MKLSNEQGAAVLTIKKWLKSKSKRFVLSGYAGTGKTTIARHLAGEIRGKVCFIAYTGKAANVLREKGCPNTSTIHSAIYTLIEDRNGNAKWVLDIESSPLRTAALVVVDEYSMIPKELRQDLEQVANRILYLGDPFQLPPVKGECDLQTDLMLQEVHRQALDSGIIRAATDVRSGKRLEQTGQNISNDFSFIKRSDVVPEQFTEADQVIVGYNKTRQAFNSRFREIYQYSEAGLFPQIGEKVICLRNNRELGIFNGQIEKIEKNSHENKDGESVDLLFSGQSLQVWKYPFIDEAVPKEYEMQYELFDYSYAITAHKSQGSEWDNVLIYNQPIGKTAIDRAKWLYTAITRAKEKCILVQP